MSFTFGVCSSFSRQCHVFISLLSDCKTKYPNIVPRTLQIYGQIFPPLLSDLCSWDLGAFFKEKSKNSTYSTLGGQCQRKVEEEFCLLVLDT